MEEEKRKRVRGIAENKEETRRRRRGRGEKETTVKREQEEGRVREGGVKLKCGEEEAYID